MLDAGSSCDSSRNHVCEETRGSACAAPLLPYTAASLLLTLPLASQMAPAAASAPCCRPSSIYFKASTRFWYKSLGIA